VKKKTCFFPSEIVQAEGKAQTKTRTKERFLFSITRLATEKVLQRGKPVDFSEAKQRPLH
jgi:hypothetical protein